jgi:hypothetical protein
MLDRDCWCEPRVETVLDKDRILNEAGYSRHGDKGGRPKAKPSGADLLPSMGDDATRLNRPPSSRR